MNEHSLIYSCTSLYVHLYIVYTTYFVHSILSTVLQIDDQFSKIYVKISVLIDFGGKNAYNIVMKI